jgi:hypothetical protein
MTLETIRFRTDPSPYALAPASTAASPQSPTTPASAFS